MTPTAEQIRLAAMNHCQLPGRTHAARIRDALAQIKESKKGKPARGRISAGLNVGIKNERTQNITLSADKNHPPTL